MHSRVVEHRVLLLGCRKCAANLGEEDGGWVRGGGGVGGWSGAHVRFGPLVMVNWQHPVSSWWYSSDDGCRCFGTVLRTHNR